MSLNKETQKKIVKIITYTILLFAIVQNPAVIAQVVRNILSLFAPFLIGLAVAFVINLPMKKIESLLFGRKAAIAATAFIRAEIEEEGLRTAASLYDENKKPRPADNVGKSAHPLSLSATKMRGFLKQPSVRRAISLVVTLEIVLGVFFIAIFLVVPELSRTISQLATVIPEYFEKLQLLVGVETAVADLFPQLAAWFSSLELDWAAIGEAAAGFLPNFSAGNVVSSTVSVLSMIFNGVLNSALGLIFALYILTQKEWFGEQARMIFKAYLKPATNEKLMYVLSLTNLTFSNFLSGQCLEALILGTLFFAFMSLFGFPYAVMISVLLAITALVPVFGAFVGAAIGVFMMLTVSLKTAFGFLILFLIMQQIEGNFIYPKVVGNTVGLPPMWVLLAVTLGASTMGILGMLLFIPIMSVLYALLWKDVDKRLAGNGENDDTGDSDGTTKSW